MTHHRWTWTSRDETAPVWPGRHQQLGATWSPESTNFAVHAPNATRVWLCLFDGPATDGEEMRLELTETTLGIWHGAVPDLPVGQRYGYRVEGPWDPAHGMKHNPAKLLVDPYARAITGEIDPDAPDGALLPHDPSDPDVRSDVDSAPYVPRSVVVHDDFDWGEDTQLRTRLRDTVVYELHVKGFTKLHDRVPEEQRGTYAGLATPWVLDYLNDLGVTAVELLPVQQFASEPGLVERGVRNYWGYNTLGYFAPHGAYSASGDGGEQVTEFKQMVKDFHAAGIEVILDVVYNHTCEGGSLGPSLSFRGLDDAGFYRRAAPAAEPGNQTKRRKGPEPRGAEADHYWDVTGCGNTVDTDDDSTLRLILDSLRYWVTEMHVDGFRFDLASALARTGHDVDMRSAFLTTIRQDPVLRHVKLIAEPWDASMEGWQVGQFPPPWTEWNDRYRDTMRDYWRAATDGVREVASRLAGSSDMYADDGRSPYTSINFLTAHDGFTMRDLVSYDDKHNEANGEDNRDGTDNNRSWNHGEEGPTDDPEIDSLRRRQAANMLVTLALSSGVPMITAGDERGRTQGGNNNAYCQDNEISWIDWRPDDAWLDVYETVRTALRLRRDHPALRQRHHFSGEPTIEGGPKDLVWLHPAGREMNDSDWHDGGLHAFGMFLSGDPLRAPGKRGEQLRDDSFLLALNAQPSDVEFSVPDQPWFSGGEVVLSTDPKIEVGDVFEAGSPVTVAARSLVLVRAH